jgi:hypothetical protein
MSSWVIQPWQSWDYKWQEGFLAIGKKVGGVGVLK